MRPPVPVILSLLFANSLLAQPAQYGEPNGSFPNWEERVIAQLTNRARVAPATELAGCPAGQCLEAACYAPVAPLMWNYDLNQAARFHSASMGQFPFFGHDTPCQLFADLDARFPGSSDGSFASSCSASGTTGTVARASLFGASLNAENISAGNMTPRSAFYGWLYESADRSTCGFTMANGHRYNILANGSAAMGVGYAAVSGSTWGTYWTQDFGGWGAIPKIPSGSHWTAVNGVRNPSGNDSSVEFWANWYDLAGGAPATATVVVDNVTVTMTRTRGSATNGAYSATVSNVSSGCHSYYFSFTDSSLNIVRYPTTGALGFGAGCPDYQGGVTAPAAPTGVSATATSSAQVQVSWSAASGATSYQIYRRSAGGSYALRGEVLAATTFSDSAPSNGAYLYRVRAVNAGGSSGDSASDLATTVMFTDDPLGSGTRVKAAHLAELRTAVSAVRALAGSGAATYSDAASAGVRVRAIHITELRTYLDQAMASLGLTTGAWSDPTLDGLPMRTTHVQQIRNRVK